jgi:hypothetical protein
LWGLGAQKGSVQSQTQLQITEQKSHLVRESNVNWKMWMAISGWVLVVLGLVAAYGEFTNADVWANISPTVDLLVDGVLFAVAAIVWAVSWYMDRSSA